MATNGIENLIARSQWEPAQVAIEKRLANEPNDHWLWSRLSAVKYEQRDYQGALGAAEKALEIVPDCPLAAWSYAGALDMLGRTAEAGRVYLGLIRRGLEQLTDPDEDADECWEGAEWTRGIVADSFYRLAGCLAKFGLREEAADAYKEFLTRLDQGTGGIYSRTDAVRRLKKLIPEKEAVPLKIGERIKKLEKVMARPDPAEARSAYYECTKEGVTSARRRTSSAGNPARQAGKAARREMDRQRKKPVGEAVGTPVES